MNSFIDDRNTLLSSFLAYDYVKKMKPEEVWCIAKSIIKEGKPLVWDNDEIVVTTYRIQEKVSSSINLVVVSIIASLGIRIPQLLMVPLNSKNAFEALTNINLNVDQLRETIEKENGCFVRDCVLNLDQVRVDDINNKAIIIDNDGVLIASIVSKIVLAGTTHALIDIPVNYTNFKINSTEQDGLSMLFHFKEVADYFGLKTHIFLSNENYFVNHSIGSSLEAKNALAVLQNTSLASTLLRKKAVFIAREILQLAWNIEPGLAEDLVIQKINTGEAFAKLINICEAQGGFYEPKQAKFCKTIKASCSGIIAEIDNQKIANIAALAGVSDTFEAGVDFRVLHNEYIQVGQPLFSIHASSSNQLELAYEYYKKNQHSLIIFKN